MASLPQCFKCQNLLQTHRRIRKYNTKHREGKKPVSRQKSKHTPTPFSSQKLPKPGLFTEGGTSSMCEGGRLLGPSSCRERPSGTMWYEHAATTGGGEEASREQIQGLVCTAAGHTAGHPCATAALSASALPRPGGQESPTWGQLPQKAEVQHKPKNFRARHQKQLSKYHHLHCGGRDKTPYPRNNRRTFTPKKQRAKEGILELRTEITETKSRQTKRKCKVVEPRKSPESNIKRAQENHVGQSEPRSSTRTSQKALQREGEAKTTTSVP